MASETRLQMILAAHAPHVRSQKATALDIGCGNGQISWALKSRFELDVSCTDITNFLEYNLPFHPITNDHLEFAKDKPSIAPQDHPIKTAGLGATAARSSVCRETVKGTRPDRR